MVKSFFMCMKQVKVFGVIVSALLLGACSTKKDTFVARNFHVLTTKYNVLYNGKVAYDEGIKGIRDNFKDDFLAQLPIEPIKFSRENNASAFSNLGGPGGAFKDENAGSGPFDKAEEKAVKAIQKHSMNIYGVERNKQIDDAYLLLGKSRYFTQRFIPAIEAFNYIIAKYPKANLIHETRIWRAKSNIRIDNEEFAVETLTLLLNQSGLSDDIKEQAHTAMAMAYVKMDSVHLVKKHLWKATETTENVDQAARNMYVLGQIFGQEQNKDSAQIVFNKLRLLKKAPYKYKIHSHIELAKNTTSDSSAVVMIDKLKKLIKKRENRPYLDALYYQLAEMESDRDSVHLAIENYNKSLRADLKNAKQNTYTYERLADIKFKELDYVNASNYYDSVLSAAKNKNTLRMKRIERRVKNLASLIKYEEVLQTNDSILTLVAMSEEDRKSLFEKHIAAIKKKDEENAQKKLNNLSFGNAFGGSGKQATNKKGKWYFYNVQSLGFGENEFQRLWGTRPLEDNWRWSDKTVISQNTKKDSAIITQKNLRYELSTYLDAIPSQKKVIDSLVSDRNTALFELGLIYKEQFTNKPKSINNLERLLTLSPSEKYILPANYHLYELYQEVDINQSDKHKNVILTEYADSPFAKIILNPEQELEEDKVVDEIADLYKIAYYIYKEDNFEEAVCFIDKSLETIDKSILIAKFKLLKAYAIGKYQHKENFKKALEEVAVDYPDTEEGKQALELLSKLKK